MTLAPRVVEERAEPGEVPLWRHPLWSERFPWLFQAVTGAGDDGGFDLGLSGAQPVGEVLGRWRRVREAAGIPAAVHARQVHGAEIVVHRAPFLPGLLVMEGVDGHRTADAGLLLSVSVADCVPVFLVEEETRAVSLLHAGWRGVAGGILERALDALPVGGPAGVWLHCGPAICGECYEVGPEVHRGVNPHREPPGAPTPIDLRRAIAERAAARGVPEAQISRSAHCTRCGPGRFFSHRAGSPGRQMGLLGRRE